MAEGLEELLNKVSLGGEDADDVVAIDDEWIDDNLDIREVRDRMFLFKFSSWMERARVLVQLHGLPIEFMTTKVGTVLGEKIGEVEEIENQLGRLAWGKWLKV
ncbi:hypothetical protein DITRI_Ditri17bG0052700 [Diplodiscus trichospermus]